MVAFVGSLLLGIAMCVGVYLFSKRRPVGTPLTWGEAMFAAVVAFFIMLWIYGVVPHQWLTWAGNELGWRSDAIVAGKGSTGLFKWSPVVISKATIMDLIAVLIYLVAIGAQILIWSAWQGRDHKRSFTAWLKGLVGSPRPEGTSAYGRPLVKRG